MIVKNIKDTLYYDLFHKYSYLNYPNHFNHFNVIKTFRNSYTESFEINDIKGIFSWNKTDNSLLISNIQLRDKDKNLLSETVEYKQEEDNLYTIKNNLMYVRSWRNTIKFIEKDMISPEIIKSIMEKNDNHIISCGCCKRK